MVKNNKISYLTGRHYYELKCPFCFKEFYISGSNKRAKMIIELHTKQVHNVKSTPEKVSGNPVICKADK
jgi:hypothetical protein